MQNRLGRLGHLALITLVTATLWPAAPAVAQDAQTEAAIEDVAWLAGDLAVDGSFIDTSLSADTLDVTFLVPRAVSAVEATGLVDVASLFRLVPSHDLLPSVVLDDAVQGGLTITASIEDVAEADADGSEDGAAASAATADPSALLGDDLTFTWITSDAVRGDSVDQLRRHLGSLQGASSAVTCWGTLDGELPDPDDVDALAAASACGQGAALLVEGTTGHALVWDGATPGVSLAAEGVTLVSVLDGDVSWRAASDHAYADIGEAYLVATGPTLDVVRGDLHAQDALTILALPGVSSRFDIEQAVDLDAFRSATWFAAADGVQGFELDSHAPTGATSASWSAADGASAALGWSAVDAASITGDVDTTTDATGHDLDLPTDVRSVAAQSADLSFAPGGALVVAEGFIADGFHQASSTVAGTDAYGTAFGTLVVSGATSTDATTLVPEHDLHFDHIPLAFEAWDEARREVGALATAAQSGDIEKVRSTLTGGFVYARAADLVHGAAPGTAGHLASTQAGLESLFQGVHTSVAVGEATDGITTVFPGAIPADASEAIALVATHDAQLQSAVDDATYEARSASDIGFAAIDVPETAIFVQGSSHMPIIVEPGSALDAVPLALPDVPSPDDVPGHVAAAAYLLVESGAHADTAWLLIGDISAVAEDHSAFAITGDAVVHEVHGLEDLIGLAGLTGLDAGAALAHATGLQSLVPDMDADSVDVPDVAVVDEATAARAQLEALVALGAIDVLAYAPGTGAQDLIALHGADASWITSQVPGARSLASFDATSAVPAGDLLALVHVGDARGAASLSDFAGDLEVYTGTVEIAEAPDVASLIADLQQGSLDAPAFVPVVLDDRVAFLIASPTSVLDDVSVVDTGAVEALAASGTAEAPGLGPLHLVLALAGLAMLLSRRRL